MTSVPSPRCTVVIPTYNRASWLARCVGSTRGSGIEPLEVIVVDDGSTDDTRAVVAGLGPAVRYVHQARAGISAARNAGARLGRSRYLAFLDSDDHWLAETPARLLTVLDAHPEVAVAFGVAQFGEPTGGYRINGQHVSSLMSIPGRELPDGLRLFDQQAFCRALIRRNLLSSGTAVIRREAFDAIGGYDERIRATEDWELWIRLAERYRFALYPAVITGIVQHGGNMSRDDDLMLRGILTVIQTTYRRVSARGGPNRALIRQRLSQLHFGAGYTAYDRGDLPSARQHFTAALRHGSADPRTPFYWLAACLPAERLSQLRRWKWAVGAQLPSWRRTFGAESGGLPRP